MDWFNRPDVAAVVEKAPLRVSELSAIIEGLLDSPLLQDILVRGEVTNYTHQRGGIVTSHYRRKVGETLLRLLSV
jgi:hypothetical protein